MPPRRAARLATAAASASSDSKGKGKATFSSTTPGLSTSTLAQTPSALAPPAPPTRPILASEPLFIEAPPDAPSDDEVIFQDPQPHNHSSDISSSEEEYNLSDSDADDPVAQTYDIYINNSLSDSLYLLQYPVRSRQLPYSASTHSCPLSARIKPQSGTLELQIPINVYKNYDQEKGRAWGDALYRAKLAKEAKSLHSKRKRPIAEDNMDLDPQNNIDEDTIFTDFHEAVKHNRVLTTQTLSSKILPSQTNYFIGVFKQPSSSSYATQIHLTPLPYTTQLRPSFPHVDTLSELDKASKRFSMMDQDTPAAPVARTIQASIKAPTSTSATETDLSIGYDVLKALRKEEGEEWKELEWIDCDEEKAWEAYDELLFLKGTIEAEIEGKEEGEQDNRDSLMMDADQEDREKDPSTVAPRDDDEKGKAHPLATYSSVQNTRTTATTSKPRVKQKTGNIPILKNTLAKAEYLRLLSAPRIPKEG